ncbi:hypothetical protein UFOVP331_11 [uncultured Caudovirales phage]|uniref:Uncharacterized protein n=1 Tax=uncultured Caudovirales phage TaxID=2100421 RepID=A0A6J5LZU4_9CAUD|nr:hypothetical protein UFOVP331_11 [uncultured Caudovirales phage]
MAIQVTGLFINPQSSLIYNSPTLTLVPHLMNPGLISLDVMINGRDCIGYNNINRNILEYGDILDPYDNLIEALKKYVIQDLQNVGINQNSTFE